jgi:hypothetical protein
VPLAPRGCNSPREGIAHGPIEWARYDATTVGHDCKTRGDSAATKYAVLDLLRGLGDNEQEWHRGAKPKGFSANRGADKKAGPMSIALLKGRAQPNGRAAATIMAAAPACAKFEQDPISIPLWSSSRNTRPGPTEGPGARRTPQ